jgi:hypothetical protein
MTALYLIETDHGKLGTQITGYREDTKATVLETVADTSNKVVRVLEIIEDENSCRDVTEDFAREIRDQKAADREPISYDLKNFLHTQLGVMATHGMLEDA